MVVDTQSDQAIPGRPEALQSGHYPLPSAVTLCIQKEVQGTHILVNLGLWTLVTGCSGLTVESRRLAS